ncbi:hypothetical protein C4K19_0375 [Pseudomonas chlororaphis subsp. aurantiaca]|uniref:hypothetical protein n=1 Tax=Pseudomonas chlororaphis TaxID=587753 RepID=UPI000F561174|nr:hypothetical protein [Pseudomonas chlororaphis]AZD52193.1 hypothetical protein C4K19_0375 [Pseudomonas chlororaphis subsp. aurantiaca]AZD58371.1 hypothetical protein C4K18_0367 [Pseudomonas chlororaphis subsp. aurantiaca]
MLDKISGMVNAALLCVVIVLELTIIFLGKGWKDGLEALDHMGSFLGGAAGLTAAGVAVFGFDVWKRQISHGKYLNLIWEAMVASQRLKSHLAIAGTNLFFRFAHNHNEHFVKTVSADREVTETLIASLKDSCSAIDVLAARNGVELSNICGFLESRLMALYGFTDKESDVDAPEDPTAWAIAFSELHAFVDQEANLLSDKLKKLEQKFG